MWPADSLAGNVKSNGFLFVRLLEFMLLVLFPLFVWVIWYCPLLVWLPFAWHSSSVNCLWLFRLELIWEKAWVWFFYDLWKLFWLSRVSSWCCTGMDWLSSELIFSWEKERNLGALLITSDSCKIAWPYICYRSSESCDWVGVRVCYTNWFFLLDVSNSET